MTVNEIQEATAEAADKVRQTGGSVERASFQGSALTLRQGVIIWCTGSLTTFIILSVMWTVFRNELDAARSVMQTANATFERTEQLYRRMEKLSKDLPSAIQAMSEGITQPLDLYVQAADHVQRGMEKFERGTNQLLEKVAVQEESGLNNISDQQKELLRMITKVRDGEVETQARLDVMRQEMNTKKEPK